MGLLCAQIFLYQQDEGLHTHHGAFQRQKAVADALGAIAVVTLQLAYGTGGLAVQTAGVQGRGYIAGAEHSGFIALGDLVGADEEVQFLVTEGGGGNAVAGAVDVDDLTLCADCVGRGQIDIGAGGQIADGTAAEIQANPEVIAAYLGGGK